METWRTSHSGSCIEILNDISFPWPRLQHHFFKNLIHWNLVESESTSMGPSVPTHKKPTWVFKGRILQVMKNHDYYHKLHILPVIETELHLALEIQRRLVGVRCGYRLSMDKYVLPILSVICFGDSTMV